MCAENSSGLPVSALNIAGCGAADGELLCSVLPAIHFYHPLYPPSPQRTAVKSRCSVHVETQRRVGAKTSFLRRRVGGTTRVYPLFCHDGYAQRMAAGEKKGTPQGKTNTREPATARARNHEPAHPPRSTQWPPVNSSDPLRPPLRQQSSLQSSSTVSMVLTPPLFSQQRQRTPLLTRLSNLCKN